MKTDTSIARHEAQIGTVIDDRAETLRAKNAGVVRDHARTPSGAGTWKP